MSNANIILAGRAPQIDRAANRKRAYDTVNAEQTQQLNSLALGSQMQQMGRDAGVRNALVGLDPTAKDYHASAARAVQGIDPTVAAGFAQQGRATQAQDAQMRASELDALVKQSQVISGALYGVKTPDDIPKMRSYLESNGIDTSGMPDIRTPEDARAFAVSMQPMADQLKQQFEREKFGETQRSNKEKEAIGWKKAGRPMVSITNVGATAHDKEDAKYYSGMYQAIQEAERKSDQRTMDYKLIDTLIGDAYSGAGAKSVQSIKRAAKILNVDLGDTSGPEAAAMVSNALALQLRNPGGGAGMPGAMSDSDRQFLTQMVPGLTTSKEGRGLMIEVQRRIAKRDREVAKLAREYRVKNKYLKPGFDQLLAETVGNKNIFEDLYEVVPATTEGAMGGIPDPSALDDVDVLKGLGLEDG